MSLTNPNTPVSQQDLQDFYHKILPYMGGSFEMIANKFSKGDLYSTDEKMIGQWVDGKPLYSKTVSCGQLPNMATMTVAHGISNFEKGIRVEGYAYNGQGGYAPLVFSSANVSTNYNIGLSVDATNINIDSRASNNSSYIESYVTILYTKTTDSAISIGDDTDYSTDEKIVGTWIDGKPLYQKTFVQSISTAVGDTAYVGDLSGLDIDFGTVSEYVMIDTNGYATALTHFDVWLRVPQNNIGVTNKSTQAKAGQMYVTIQYTKTTD